MIEINESVHFRALGTTFKVLSSSVGGSAAIVEHTLEPNCIGAPMHRHTHENEISYVLEGQLTVFQNGIVQTAHAGEYIVKPLGIFHTFWNAGASVVRFIEVITPGNFENYFAELAPFLKNGQPPQLDKVRQTAQKYGLEVDMNATIPLIEKYGLNPLG
jgi:quercetin dioxygenase-like cupin family protein